MSNCADKSDDIVFLINKYQEAILMSNELSFEEKDWILGALSTAIYSFNYWNKSNIIK